ncbi:MAG TPA: YrdB family protein [Candidatus Lumbricidophila sp.]|nr:YrdB family protein [Candidatus Lumbricidophila sp.]
MTKSSTPSRAAIHDALRLVLELWAVVTLGIFGFTQFALPLNLVIGIGAPLLAITLWALFRSPQAVFAVDPFVKALIEIAVFSTAAIAWWIMAQPILAVLTAVLAGISGVVVGRRDLTTHN